MSNTFRSLIMKLKNRRKPRLWRRHRKTSAVHEEEALKEVNALAERMSALMFSEVEPLASVDDTQKRLTCVFGDESLINHDFEISGNLVTWPGPSYDENSQFAPGIFDKQRPPKRRPRQKVPKRRLSHEDRPALQRREERAASCNVKPLTRTTKLSRQPQYFGSPPPRNPPRHLLSLPGEIRNHIFKYVLGLEKDDTIVAQFRLVIKPKRGRGDKAHTIRRLPREPSLALVCHKLQHEVLSLFYGENTFIFTKSEYPRVERKGTTNQFTMTHEESIARWAPKFGFADCIRHIELHFRAREPTFKTFCIIYTLTKLVSGQIVVYNNLEDHDCCECFEREVLRGLLCYLKEDNVGENVLQTASKLSRDRRLALQKDKNMAAEFPYKIYRPKLSTCEECGLECLREIGSGL